MRSRRKPKPRDRSDRFDLAFGRSAQPRVRQNSADQIVGRRRCHSHHPGAEQIAAALSGGAAGLAGDAGHRRTATAQSGHHQRDRVRPRGLVDTVDADAVYQLRTARRQAARTTPTIWSSTCTANSAPPCSRLGPARRCGSASTGRAHGCGTPRRGTFSAEARKHAWQGAREGSWLAYTHHIPVPTLDLHAVDRYLSVGPILGLEDGPPIFLFRFRKRQSSASRRCCGSTLSPVRR